MKKNDTTFIKVMIILVIAILAVVSVVYFMQKPTVDRPIRNLPIEIGDQDPSESEVSDEDIIDEDNQEVDLDESELNLFEKYPNRRYIETHVEMCDDVKFTCEEFEFRFSDETGCGCELTKEYIEEQAKIEEELSNQPDSEDLTEEELPPQEEMPEDISDEDEEEMTVCTMEYAPVCGLIDGEYQTFGNDCMAEAAGVTEYTEGECAE